MDINAPSKACRCEYCLRNKKIQTIIANRNVDELVVFLEEIYEQLENVEFDLEYFKAILSGQWHTATQQLTEALEKSKKFDLEDKNRLD